MRIHYSIDAMVADQTIKALFACSLFAGKWDEAESTQAGLREAHSCLFYLKN